MTVYRDPAGHWWASFVVQAGVVEGPLYPGGPATGLDVGLTRFATTEDPCTDIENPRHARRAAKALARSQRNLALKRRGPKNRAKAKVRVARVSATVADQRRDFHPKAARDLGPPTTGSGWRKAGKEVVVYPARDTTQRCTSCGVKAKPRIELSDRVFWCGVCGFDIDRDRNATRNLHPVRLGPDGRAEPSGVVPVGSDGSKPRLPAGVRAA